MKNAITIIALIICQISFSQLKQEDIRKLGIEEGTYQLDVLTQKLEGDTFITTKQKRYAVTIFEFAIESQKIYDSIDGNIKMEYLYDETAILKRIKYSDFDNNLKKEVEYQYNWDGDLTLEITYNENGEETINTTHNYDGCMSKYIDDLLDDSDPKNFDENFHCETVTIVKKISNYTTSLVYVYKIGFGKIRKYDLKGDKDAPISRFYTYNKDENGTKISIDVTRGDRVKRYKTNEYNNKGDLIHMKSGFVEFFYTYKYDEKGNWIEKIETSKVKSKRIVYKRTFTY